MAVTRTYSCPDCSGEFSFLHLTRDEPPPSYCALCGAWMGESPEPMPAAPTILKPHNKAPDLVYRHMEAESAERAEAAGAPSLKITDLKDNLREGDVAAANQLTPQNSMVMGAGAAMGMGEGASFGFGGGGAFSAADAAAIAKADPRGTGARAIQFRDPPPNVAA